MLYGGKRMRDMVKVRKGNHQLRIEVARTSAYKATDMFTAEKNTADDLPVHLNPENPLTVPQITSPLGLNCNKQRTIHTPTTTQSPERREVTDAHR